MRVSESTLATLLVASIGQTYSFAPQIGGNGLKLNSIRSPVKVYATVEDETKADKKENDGDENNSKDKVLNMDDGMDEGDKDVEGLPWWWDIVWKLDIMQKGEPGMEKVSFGKPYTFELNKNMIRHTCIICCIDLQS